MLSTLALLSHTDTYNLPKYHKLCPKQWSTVLFEIQRGVRQGDPLSPYLFIMVLEVLAISIRETKNIQGILVGGTEIKLELFADDLTAFLRNDQSFDEILNVIAKFGKCTGLTVNFAKTEMLLLGNPAIPTVRQATAKIKIKKAVKILGVQFTYDRHLGRKLNFEEIIVSIKTKLRLWKWRNLTIIRRVQIVKTFVIPMLMYRAGSICIDQKVVTEANIILFDFIWKGKDKVKRSSLISDIEDGGFKAPHLDSIIKTQRIMSCKKFADDEPGNWKLFLLHYLEPVGGKLILACNFHVNKLPINLPRYYKECLESFSLCSAATQKYDLELTHEEISNSVIWNDKFICINGKSVFNHHLLDKGLIRVGDMVTERNQLVFKCNPLQMDFSLRDVFDLMVLFDATLTTWRQSLEMKGYVVKHVFPLQDYIQLVLKKPTCSH